MLLLGKYEVAFGHRSTQLATQKMTSSQHHLARHLAPAARLGLWSSDPCSLASSPYRSVIKAHTELTTAAQHPKLCPQTQRNDSSPSETPGFGGPSALLGLGYHVRQQSCTWELSGAGRLLPQADPTDRPHSCDRVCLTHITCTYIRHAESISVLKSKMSIMKMLRVEQNISQIPHNNTRKKWVISVD